MEVVAGVVAGGSTTLAFLLATGLAVVESVPSLLLVIRTGERLIVPSSSEDSGLQNTSCRGDSLQSLLMYVSNIFVAASMRPKYGADAFNGRDRYSG